MTEGFDLIERIEREVSVDENDRPTVPVTIADCGEIVKPGAEAPPGGTPPKPSLSAGKSAAAKEAEGKAEAAKEEEDGGAEGEARAKAFLEIARKDKTGLNIAEAVANLAKEAYPDGKPVEKASKPVELA